MLNKLFGSIDFGKLTLDTGAGLIVTVALLLFTGAFTSSHSIEKILNGNAAHDILVALVIIVVSSILGIMVDSFFHTSGRWIARRIWPNLDRELSYREQLIRELGFTSQDEFEWIQNNGKTVTPDNIESNYMRYTEVAGSSAYATILLSAAMALFLRWEYNMSMIWTVIISACIAAVALVLLFTSAASLTRYEMNKTAMALDEIHRLNPHLKTRKTEKSEKWDTVHHSRKSLMSIAVFLPMVITCLLGGFVARPSLTGSDMKVISTLENNSVPVISINATINTTANLTSPTTFSSIKIISLDDTVYHHQNLSLENADANGNLSLADLPEPPGWQLKAAIGRDVAEDNVYVNVQLSVDNINISNISAGNWIVPLIVKDDSGKHYLLAYIQVQVTITK